MLHPPALHYVIKLKLIAFRFGFAYWTLFLVPYAIQFLNGLLPIAPLGWLASGIDVTSRILVTWVGVHLLHQAASAVAKHPTGSGDTLFDWVQAFTILVAAIVATAFWTVRDRRPTEYPVLREWLRVAIRYGLAMALVVYGLGKVFPLQYSAPQLERFLQTYGNSSPMGILWTMMNASRPYQVFTGLVETTAGLLLLWRRTTILGALLGATAMTNVVALNFMYDVPVKLFSSHLLAMSIYLLLPELPRLGRVLLVGESRQSRSFRRSEAVLKFVLIAAIVGGTAYQAWTLKRSRDPAIRPLLYGVYDVRRFSIDGRESPPLLTDPARWRRVVFNGFGSSSIYLMDDRVQRYGTRLDEAQQTVTLLAGPDSAHPGQIPLRYERGAEWLRLTGKYDGAEVDVQLLRLGDERMFLLVNRGFHWIQEYPLNR